MSLNQLAPSGSHHQKRAMKLVEKLTLLKRPDADCVTIWDFANALPYLIVANDSESPIILKHLGSFETKQAWDAEILETVIPPFG